MKSNPTERARAAFQRAVAKAQYQAQESGILGWRRSETDVLITVPGRANYVYVTRLDQTVHIARNEANVPRAAFFPVRLVLEGNTYVIKGRDNRDEAALANLPDSGYGVPNHPHAFLTLSDVLPTGLSDGQLFVWDAGAGKLVNVNVAVESVNGQTGAVVLDTDDVAEGAALYFTDERAQDAIGAILVDGNGIDLTYNDATPSLTAALTALTSDWDIGEDRAIAAERLEARDAEGLRLEDDGGNLGVFIEDGGQVGIGANATTPDNLLELWASAISSSLGITRDSTAFSATIEMDTNRSPSATDPRYFFGLRDATKYFTFGRWNGSSVGEDLVISVEGYVGIGRNAPQGKLHVHDGTAGWGLFTKTGVNATPQTILPNGAGDVVRAVYGSVILTDGTNTAAPSALALRHGGTTTFDVSAGTSTWRTTLNADGSLTVARTAGTGTATISYDLHWM